MNLTYLYEEPRTSANHGVVYLAGCGQPIMNFWTEGDWGNRSGKINFNRTGISIDAEIEVAPYFDTLEEGMAWLQKQVEAKKGYFAKFFSYEGLPDIIRQDGQYVGLVGKQIWSHAQVEEAIGTAKKCGCKNCICCKIKQAALKEN